MKIICIEEHAADAEIGKVTGPLLMKEAPYMAFSCTENVVKPYNPHKPMHRTLKEANILAAPRVAFRSSVLSKKVKQRLPLA